MICKLCHKKDACDKIHCECSDLEKEKSTSMISTDIEGDIATFEFGHELYVSIEMGKFPGKLVMLEED